MSSLARYYDWRAATFDRTDFLSQVGHTEGGLPIGEDKYRAILEGICRLLELTPGDNLLDLCCGNGVITHDLSPLVHSVTGVDFSPALIEIATQHNGGNNIRYKVGDALDIAEIVDANGGPFTKILMYGALQHFRQSDLERLLDGILGVASEHCTILFGHVLDAGRKWDFYGTPRRRVAHFVRRLSGRDWMGTWWDRKRIAEVAGSRGLKCSIHEIDARTHGFRLQVRRKA